MKSKILSATLLLFLLIEVSASCQNPRNNTSSSTEQLVAVTTSVFIDNADKGEYYAGITITKGKIKIGDKIDAVGKTGNRFSFEIKEIKVNDVAVKETGATENAFLVLHCNGNANGFDAGYSITQKGAAAPSANTPAANGGNVSAQNPTSTAAINCTLNGKNWQGNGFFNSYLFYTKGVEGAYNGKPYLELAFKANKAPDSRQLSLLIYNYNGTTGVFQNEQIEVLLSGAENGNSKDDILQGHKIPSAPTNFKIEINSFEKVSATEAKISGKISGELKGIFGAANASLQNGIFQNLKVRIFNDAY